MSYYSSGSESDDSGSSSGSESSENSWASSIYDTDQEIEYKSRPGSCKIRDTKIIPTLEIGCPGQEKTRGQKCFNNKCVVIEKVLSGDDNFFGKVAIVKIENNSYVVKWNRSPDDVNDMYNEIRLQGAASAVGLAPKIKSYYRDSNYFYVFMENLVDQGYQNIFDLYYDQLFEDADNTYITLPRKLIRLIAEGLCKLNNMNISHGDVHPQNVFYNSLKNKIMFIDFGLAQHHPNQKEARAAEKFDFTFWVSDNETTSTIPLNWINIQDILKKANGRCETIVKKRRSIKKKYKKKKKSKKKKIRR
jgi:serine/threonine protein kinase